MALLQENNLNHSLHYLLCQYLSATLNSRPLPIFHQFSLRHFLSCMCISSAREMKTGIRSPFWIFFASPWVKILKALRLSSAKSTGWHMSRQTGGWGDYWLRDRKLKKDCPACCKMLQRCVYCNWDWGLMEFFLMANLLKTFQIDFI